MLARGKIGETYNIGGRSELSNKELVLRLCALLDRTYPMPNGKSYASLITYVKDRPGHDFRYAIDEGKIARELGWAPQMSFEEGLENTVHWYVEHKKWSEAVRDGSYRDWIARNYEKR